MRIRCEPHYQAFFEQSHVEFMVFSRGAWIPLVMFDYGSSQAHAITTQASGEPKCAAGKRTQIADQTEGNVAKAGGPGLDRIRDVIQTLNHSIACAQLGVHLSEEVRRDYRVGI